MKYVIANWKAHKNINETKSWVDEFMRNLTSLPDVDTLANKLTIIICPPFPFIDFLKRSCAEVPYVKIGVQTVSSIINGSVTGEVTAESLSGLVDYVIIGHSERRALFNESEAEIEKKIALTKKCGIEGILCVRGSSDVIYPDAAFVAYEPMEAIGTGLNETASDVLHLKSTLPMAKNQHFIYGGSVNEDNCQEYFTPGIDGVLVGTASLDPHQFFQICVKASEG